MLGDSTIWETSVRLVRLLKNSVICFPKVVVLVINTKFSKAPKVVVLVININSSKLIYRMLKKILMFVFNFNYKLP